MANHLPPGARLRWPPALLDRRSVGVLALVVAGWLVFRAFDARGPASVAGGASSSPAKAALLAGPGSRDAAPDQTTREGGLASGADTGTFRLPAGLPLRRSTAPDVPRGTLLGFALLCASALAVAGVVLLRRRLHASLALPDSARADGWLRWLPGALPSQLRVLQTIRLTGRASVHVLRWDEKEWLVGCAEHGMTILGQRPAATAEPCPEPQSEGTGAVQRSAIPACTAAASEGRR